MRSRYTAPAAAAIVILALSACTGADPTSPTATAPGSSATTPASSGAAAGAADWPTYHGTMTRAGVSTTMSAASGTPKRIQSLKLDGEVFASPIVVHGLTIVATEQDTVYAFNQSYRQVWKRSLGSPSPAEEQGDLGGIGGQVDVQNICRSFGGAAVDGGVVYLPCTDGVRAVRVDDAGKLHVLWHTSDSITGSPVIGGGRIWELDTNACVLHALDPSTGKRL